MNISIILAEILGIIFIITGFSVFQMKFMNRVMDEIEKSPAFFWLSGLAALTIGSTIVTLHNLWVSDWRVVITLIGWVALLKGIMLMIFPNTAHAFWKKLRSTYMIFVGGALAIIIGIFLVYMSSK